MVHRQIEKLQKTVNGLLSLCTGKKPDTPAAETDPSTQDSKYERLGIMLLKAQDGELEERYLRRMEKWLLCDPAAMRHYVDFQSLTAMLTMHFNPDRFTFALFRPKAHAAK